MVSKPINEINTPFKLDKSTIDNFKCEICQGYIIDATIITECLHPFCKACIVLYINDQQVDDYRCPTCNVEIQNPRNCLQYDPRYQRLIYKFLPNLLKNEIQRREQFYSKSSPSLHFDPVHLASCKVKLCSNLDELVEKKLKTKAECILTKESLVNIKLVFDDSSNTSNRKHSYSYLINNSRYIQCTSKTPLRILERLLRNKYEIPKKHKIYFKYMDQELDDLNETLLELFICFILTKDDLFEIKYTIRESNGNSSNKRMTDNGHSKSLTTANSDEITESESKRMKLEPYSNNNNQQILKKDFLKIKLKPQKSIKTDDEGKINGNSDTKTKRGRPTSSVTTTAKQMTNFVKIAKKDETQLPIVPQAPIHTLQPPQSCIKIIQINTTAQYLETSISTAQFQSQTSDLRVDEEKEEEEECEENSFDGNVIDDVNTESNASTIKKVEVLNLDSNNTVNTNDPLDLTIKKTV